MTKGAVALLISLALSASILVAGRVIVISAAGVTKNSYADGFDTGSNWTHVCDDPSISGSEWVSGTTNYSRSASRYNVGSLNTTTQSCKIKVTLANASKYHRVGCFLRGNTQGSGSFDGYFFWFKSDGAEVEWGQLNDCVIGGALSTTAAYSTVPVFFAAAVTGTGASTNVRMWTDSSEQSGNDPSAWGTADYDWTGTPTTEYTDTHCGVAGYNGNTSPSNPTGDNWRCADY